jgi:putative ubiquitin-RnfH superfamily antitoxin RatB of RatAB toxin-antitoxin module
MIYNQEDLNIALNNNQEFKRLIETASDLIGAGGRFPAQADQLMRPLLTDPEEFIRLIRATSDLAGVARQFPTQADQLIRPLLTDPEEFKRLIRVALDLIIVARQFPTQADQLIQPLLTDPEEFNRLIKTAGELAEVGRQFPKHAEVFQQPSVEAALTKIKMNSDEAKAYTKGATVSALAGGELSKKLPPEITSHIGDFLGRKHGAKLAQTHKAAHKTATDEEKRQSTLRKR